MTTNSNKGKRSTAPSASTAKKTSIRPLTVDQQLQGLRAWKKAIDERCSPSSGTSVENLVDQWEALEAADSSIQANANFVLRGSTHNSTPPLAQLFEYVEHGFYPPPELLLVMLEAWKKYCLAASADVLTLEEAFFGKPKPRAGNYAAQAMKKRKDLGAAHQLGEYRKQGKSKEEAASLIAKQYGGSEESIKKIRAINPDGWRDQEK